MKNQLLIVILMLATVVPGLSLVSPVNAQYVGICSGEKLIYTQDTRFNPGRDNDTAIIKDRNGNLLVQVKQRNDNYVYWPATYEVPLFAGESLQYRGSDHDFLTADLLDANHALIQKLTFKNTVGINVAQNGFLRFNSGEKAKEYNKLVICPVINNNNPNPNPNPTTNRAPIWFQVPAQNVGVGQTIQFSVAATDPDGQALTYSSVSLPAGANFDGGNRSFSWTPSASQLGSYSVILRASDGSLTSDMTVGISVYSTAQPPVVYNPPPVYNYPPIYNYPPVYNYPPTYNYPPIYNNYPYYSNYSNNQPPYFFPVPDQSVKAGNVVQFNIYATDPNGDGLTYSVSTMPVGASFNSYERVFSWVPGKNQVGRHTIVFIASDGTNQIDMNVYIDVLPGSGNGPVNYVNPPIVVNTSNNYDSLYQQLISLQASVISLLQNRGGVTVVAPIAEKLKMFNVKIDRQFGGGVIVSWDTNKPASSGVLFDLVSKAEITKDYGAAYAQSSPADYNIVTAHRVNLGKLKSGTTYYFRVVSQVGDEFVVSSERSFVVLSSIMWTLFNPWLILLILLILLAIVVVVLKK